MNIVAGNRVVPELLQEKVTPENIADALSPLLNDADANNEVRKELSNIRDRLGKSGASARAAAVVLELLGKEQV